MLRTIKRNIPIDSLIMNSQRKMPQNSRIVICGAARDVGNRVDNFFNVMAESFSSFSSVSFVVCESFSSDQTLEKLKTWKENGLDLFYFTDTKVALNEESRTVRIASARNLLQDAVRERYSNYDYVVIADMDGVNKDLTNSVVNSCWSDTKWNAIFANQPFRYYDIWALRAKNWCENDCWLEYEELLIYYKPKTAHRIAIKSKIRKIATSMNPIQVESAFGGLGIYETSTYLSGRYSGKNGERDICEHVPFHKDLTEKGFKLFIMPNLVNLRPSTQIVGMFKGAFKRLIRLLGS
jgi:hypothetical protein